MERMGWSNIYFKGSQAIIPNDIVFLSPETILSLANGADADKMTHSATFNYGYSQFALTSAYTPVSC